MKPIILCILDGWGIRKSSKYNAIKQANPDFYNYLLENYPNSKLFASGSSVGLPDSQMGNSEIGHAAIGSGRVILQDFPKITKDLTAGKIFQTQKFQSLVNYAEKNKSKIHLFGLCSDGGIHSHIYHLEVMLEKLLNFDKLETHLHFVTDGRDTPPKSAKKYLSRILSKFSHKKNFHISSIMGRFFAMDRDNRAERTALAVSSLLGFCKKKFDNPLEEIENNYQNHISDEFIEPSVNSNFDKIEPKDVIIFFNFRADRMKQIVTEILSNCNCNAFSFINYQTNKPTDYFYGDEKIEDDLPTILSKQGIKQLRIAETEKYAHVTYFFNSRCETTLPGEERILVDSPKIAKYDKQPEMSLPELQIKLLNEIDKKKYGFILINVANADMVGHTGNFNAAIKAVQAIDEFLKNLYKKTRDSTLIITADHGNIEHMFNDKEKQIHTSHTTNPVPFILVDEDAKNNNIKLNNGTLPDIAPTILDILKIKKPKSMTGKTLIIKKL